MIITIYGRADCPYCDKAKKLSSQLINACVDVDIEHKDCPKGSDVLPMLSQQVGKELTTVPQVFVDGEHIGGYNDLAWWVNDAIVRDKLIFK